MIWVQVIFAHIFTSTYHNNPLIFSLRNRMLPIAQACFSSSSFIASSILSIHISIHKHLYASHNISFQSLSYPIISIMKNYAWLFPRCAIHSAQHLNPSFFLFAIDMSKMIKRSLLPCPLCVLQIKGFKSGQHVSNNEPTKPVRYGLTVSSSSCPILTHQQN